MVVLGDIPGRRFYRGNLNPNNITEYFSSNHAQACACADYCPPFCARVKWQALALVRGMLAVVLLALAHQMWLCFGILVVKKRNTTSVVWDYFRLKAHSDGGLVSSEAHLPVCRSCRKSVPAKGCNTTNLLAHLRDRHPDLHAEAHPRITKKGLLLV